MKYIKLSNEMAHSSSKTICGIPNNFKKTMEKVRLFRPIKLDETLTKENKTIIPGTCISEMDVSNLQKTI